MKIRIAIDILGGRCVRLTEGDYQQSTAYYNDPLEAARFFEDQGFRDLHLVDLDGARGGAPVHLHLLETIAAQTRLNVDFGGGIKTEDSLKAALSAGAQQVTVGSAAARNPERFLEWVHRYGPDRLILGADARRGKIAVQGWQELTNTSVEEFVAEMQQGGVTSVVCTDIAKDGRLAGPNLQLYERVLNHAPGIHLVASGGIRSLQDLAALRQIGVHDAILGKAIYEHALDLTALCQELDR